MRLAKDPQYSQWFLQAAGGPLYSYSGCQQMGEGSHPTLPCTAYFWNLANDSARTFFVEHIVAPLAGACGLASDTALYRHQGKCL